MADEESDAGSVFEGTDDEDYQYEEDDLEQIDVDYKITGLRNDANQGVTTDRNKNCVNQVYRQISEYCLVDVDRYVLCIWTDIDLGEKDLNFEIRIFFRANKPLSALLFITHHHNSSSSSLYINY